MDYEDYMTEYTWADMVPKDVYVCDPMKNTRCSKENCRVSCFLTRSENCRADGFRTLNTEEATDVNVIADLERFAVRRQE